MTNNLETANTILAQLGGNRFIVMTGAKHPLAIENGLQFKLPRNECGVQMVRIILDVNDTYRMEFCRVRKNVAIPLTVKTDVYCDMLQEVFTDQTGLYSTL